MDREAKQWLQKSFGVMRIYKTENKDLFGKIEPKFKIKSNMRTEFLFPEFKDFSAARRFVTSLELEYHYESE